MKRHKLNKFRARFQISKRSKSKYFATKPVVILLSGGASKRFGCDKMAYVNSKRVHLYKALAKRLSAHVLLYECAKFPRLANARFICDKYESFAPANALKSIEASGILSKHARVIILAGDYFKATLASLRWLLMQANKAKKSSVIYQGHMLYGIYYYAHLKQARNLSTEAKMSEFFAGYEFTKELKANKKCLQNFNFKPTNVRFLANLLKT